MWNDNDAELQCVLDDGLKSKIERCNEVLNPAKENIILLLCVCGTCFICML